MYHGPAETANAALRPEILIVEAIESNLNRSGSSARQLRAWLEERGYVLFTLDGARAAEEGLLEHNLVALQVSPDEIRWVDPAHSRNSMRFR